MDGIINTGNEDVLPLEYDLRSGLFVTEQIAKSWIEELTKELHDDIGMNGCEDHWNV